MRSRFSTCFFIAGSFYFFISFHFSPFFVCVSFHYYIWFFYVPFFRFFFLFSTSKSGCQVATFTSNWYFFCVEYLTIWALQRFQYVLSVVCQQFVWFRANCLVWLQSNNNDVIFNFIWFSLICLLILILQPFIYRRTSIRSVE